MTDDLEFGISWFINQNSTNPNRITGRIDTGSGSATNLPAKPTDVGAVPFGVGRPFQLVSISADAVRAVLNAKGEDNKARVLASPQLMVLDNQKAQIKVGSRISVQTQTQTGVSTSTGVLNSFQYLETGILLTLTPRINSNNQVTLEVNQEVSNADASSVTAINPNPDITQRTVQTSVVIGSGESIVLAGLIREESGRSSVGVPILSKIPVLGAAFGNQKMSRSRTELVMILTPRIVNDARQAAEASEELRSKLPLLHDAVKNFITPLGTSQQPSLTPFPMFQMPPSKPVPVVPDVPPQPPAVVPAPPAK
jgi:general secretion pathway protein D